MIEKLCKYLTDKIRENDTDIDDERAEEINYGLECIIGELPKGLIILAISYFLGLFKFVVVATVVLLIYRAFAGGVHLKSNLCCLFISGFFAIGIAYIASNIYFINEILLKTMLTCLNLVLVSLYAPADTYNRPITSEEQRHKQKIESFLTVAILYLLSVFFIKDSAISNLVIFTMTIESFMITPFAYKIFDNKYGIDRINEINREEERVC